MPTTSAIPVASLLDTWSRWSWPDGVQVDQLRELDALEVRTRNSLYRITVISGHTGDSLVSGGRFFPIATRARLNGSTLGGAFLKLRGVYPGFRLELQVDRQVIVTSEIVSVAVVAGGILPASSTVQ